MIPTRDMGAIFWGDGNSQAVTVHRAVIKGGEAYADDPERGAAPMECAKLAHVGALADGDSVIVLGNSAGAGYIIGKL